METKVRILIVDDQPFVLDMLVLRFRRLGYEVESAESGEDALKLLEQKRFDIVISDIMMPKMTGIDLLRIIRQEYPMIHVIMFTGYTKLENALAAMRLGADTCVFKMQDEIGELERAVARAVEDIQRWIGILKKLSGNEWKSEWV